MGLGILLAEFFSGAAVAVCEGFSGVSTAMGDKSRYAYMIEVNPWTDDEDLKKALLFRGTIVAAWAYIETTLIELAIRSSRMREYSMLSERYPYKLEGRFKYMRKVLEADGPFEEFRSFGMQFLKRFEASAEIRHIMAHAKMRVSARIEFIDYSPGSNGTINKRTRRYTLSDLERLSLRVTRLSRIMQMGYSAIQARGFLPAFD